MEGALEHAPDYALALAVVFFVGALVLGSLNVCVGSSFNQTCGPIYLPTGHRFAVFGGVFPVLWVILIAMNEVLARRP